MNGIITQVCVVVQDVHKANTNWAKVLGVPEAEIATVFPEGIFHFTHGTVTKFKDLQVAKYELDSFVLELLQPGSTPSPWKDFLERNGQGVFHFCLAVKDRKGIQHTLGEIGVGLPYHIGYYPGGSYSYVDCRNQLGLELSVNHHDGNVQWFEDVTAGRVQPLDDLK